MNRTLDVYFDNRLAGHLLLDEYGQMLFTYDRSWLKNENAIPLSWSLPLRKEAFTPKECRGFFSGILPEASNRKTIARILGISAQNTYAMLEQIGGECAGAIQFLAKGMKLPETSYSYRLLNENALAETLRKLPKHPLLAGEPGLRLSLAGAQHKIAVYINDTGQIFLPLGGAPSTHILKPAIERFPDLVLNEVLCLTLAQAVGIPAANTRAGSACGIEYILVERYDRLKLPGKKYPIRLHQEDFCQALGILPEHKYQSEGGPGLKACFSLLREASSLPAVDTQNLLSIVIFNTIIGNHDAHGKNFSLLFSKTGTRLAPAYDMLSTVYYPELTPKMAMKIGGESESARLKLDNFDRFAADAGLSTTAVRKHIMETAEKIKDKLSFIKADYIKIADLVTLIHDRAEKMVQLVKNSN